MEPIAPAAATQFRISVVADWSFAIVADFTNPDTYKAYDLDAEHNRLRAELASFAEQVARVQFDLPG